MVAGYVVFRLTHGRWLPISRTFDTERQAHRHLETLPTDWEVEVRPVEVQGAA